jgi:hypothetical protein
MWGEARDSFQLPVAGFQKKQRPPKRRLLYSRRYLRLNDLAALQALGADAHAFAAGADFGAHGAQVHVPATLGHVVGVADVVSRLRLFAADSADLCHDFYLFKV